LENRLNGEINIDSVWSMDEEIREHERTLRVLEEQRREYEGFFHQAGARPELVVETLQAPTLSAWEYFPLEGLPEGNFDELEEESHNFLSVYHHRFEVASRTRELWSFWGNMLQDWARWRRSSGTALLDLVLDSYESHSDSFDFIPRNALQARATLRFLPDTG
jgi:hypothetical protein